MVSLVAIEAVADAPDELEELPDPEASHRLQTIARTTITK
jgi:hypothetical protein